MRGWEAGWRNGSHGPTDGRAQNGRAAPVSSARLAGVAWERPILDRPLRHIKPVAVTVHLYPGRGHAVRRGPTIMLVATTRADDIGETRVDVVRFGRKLRP